MRKHILMLIFEIRKCILIISSLTVISHKCSLGKLLQHTLFKNSHGDVTYSVGNRVNTLVVTMHHAG